MERILKCSLSHKVLYMTGDCSKTYELGERKGITVLLSILEKPGLNPGL